MLQPLAADRPARSLLVELGPSNYLDIPRLYDALRVRYDRKRQSTARKWLVCLEDHGGAVAYKIVIWSSVELPHPRVSPRLESYRLQSLGRGIVSVCMVNVADSSFLPIQLPTVSRELSSLTLTKPPRPDRCCHRSLCSSERPISAQAQSHVGQRSYASLPGGRCAS